MKVMKRFMAMLLCVAMVATLFAGLTLTASATTYTDVLTRSWTGVSGTSYSGWSGKTGSASGVTYAGNSAGPNSGTGGNSIQLRSTNSSGIWTTANTNGYYVKSVTAKWHSSTTSGRVLQIYGQTSAFTGFSTSGTLLGTITYGSSSTYTLTSEQQQTYKYILLKSYSGAQYLSEIDVEWESGTTTKTLSDIAVSSNHRTFTVGDTFVKETVTATYSDSSTADVTNSATFSSPSMSTAGTKTVNVSYTEGGVTKNTSYTINVVAPTPYTLTYSVNGDTSVISGGSYTSGSSVSLPANVTAPAGYTFAGWVESPIGTEITTAPTVLTGSYSMPAANTTLYALFTRTEGGSGGGSSTYQLVTSASDLVAGSSIVIAAKDYNYAVSTTQNTNNRGQASITKSGNTITLGDGVSEFTLEAGTTTGTYSFKDSEGYLYAASSSKNYLKTQNEKSGNSSWTVSISNDAATVTAQGTNTHNLMQYNSSSSIFSAYGGAQQAICLYQKTAGSSGTTYYITSLVTKYTLTYSVNPADSGSIACDVANNGQVEEGTDVTLTATANPGYAFKNWTVAGTTDYVEDGNELLVTMTDDVNVIANFEPTYAVIFSADPAAGGDVLCYNTNDEDIEYDSGDRLTAGTEFTLMATAKSDDYVFDHWTVDGADYDEDTINLTMGTAAVNAVAHFSKLYNIIADDPANATVTFDGGKNSGSYTAGTELQLVCTVTDTENYKFSGWILYDSDDPDETNVASYYIDAYGKLTMPEFGAVLSAQIDSIGTVTASYTRGGTGSGEVTLSQTTTTQGNPVLVTVTAKPDEHNHFVKMTVDGTEVTVSGPNANGEYTYSFTLNSADVAVVVTFDEDAKNNVTVGSMTNGTVTAEPGTDVYVNTPVTLTVTPAEHYHLLSLTVDGSPATVTGNTYTFTMPAYEVEVSAVFEADPTYTVTLNQVTGGTISASKIADIYEGETITLFYTENAHWHFNAWSVVSGGATISGNTFTMPAGNVEITATYTEDAKYTVTVNTAENGSASANPTADIYEGDTVTLTATPAAHYNFDAWTVTDEDGEPVTVTSNAFTMPESNVTVTATFIEDPKATVTFSVIGDTEAIEAVTNYVGEALVLPDTVTVEGLDEDYSFIGWATTSTDGEDVKTLARVNPDGYKIPATDTVLYAVFTRTEAGGSAASLTKMAAGDTLADGDKIVVVANGTMVAMHQETVSSSYVNKYTFDGAVNTVLANDKNYFTVNTVTGGFTLGDATNGYLYNSGSNNLKVDTSNSTIWTLTDNEDGTFSIIGNSKWLSCRTDLTGDNANKWRMGGSSDSKPSGNATFDLYKVTEGSSSTTYYNTDPEVIYKYTLTVDTNIANGSVTATAGEYEEGDTVNLSYAPNTGYQFDGYVLIKDADSSDVTATYINGNTLTMPAFDVTLSANFSLIPATYYSVTPSYNAAGGSISVDPTSAEVEDLITVTIAPNAHWTLTSLTVNDEAVDLADIADDTYTFELAAPAEGKDVPVVAVFTEDAYRTLTLTAPENGVIRATWNGETYTPTTETPIVLNHVYVGDEITLTTAETTAHWHFSEWNGVTVSGNAFTMPDEDVELTAVFAEEDRIPVIFHSYDTEAAPVTVTVSDKYYSGDAVLAADVPAIAEPNGYVFKGWYTASYNNEAAPTYVTPAGTQIGSEALHFYAVYGVLSEGSSLYFKLSIEVGGTTYYVGGRTGSNKYLDSPTDAANAAQFGIDAGGYLYYTDGETKTYVSNKSNAVDLSFSTNKSDAMPWTVNETASGISFTTTAAGEREFAYNVQNPRFAAYQGNNSNYPYIFTKIGGPSYDSFTTDPARVKPELTAEDFTVIFDRDRALTFDVWAHIGLDYLKKDQVTLTFADLPTNVQDNGDGTVTFTPAATQGVVTFTYTVTDNADTENAVTATFTLKPAERVYYDETDAEMFRFEDGVENSWKDVTDERLNDLDSNVDIYEYEKENFLMYSGGTAKQVTVTMGDKPYVEFDFAGTGFEIISAMTNTSGAALIQVFEEGSTSPVNQAIINAYRGYTYDDSNPITRYTLRQVTRYQRVEDKYVAYTGEGSIGDYTYYRDPVSKEFVNGTDTVWYDPGENAVTPSMDQDDFDEYKSDDGTYVLIEAQSNWVPSDENDANTYQIPVLRVMGLTYGTYTVKVQPIYSPAYDQNSDGEYDFIFDGVNIYDPANDADYKYISLNDIVAEQGFGSVVIENNCEHPTSGDWTFAAPATGTKEGSFAKYCTECGEVTESAKFTATATAEPTVITAGATSALTYTLTSENQEVQAILDEAEKTAVWSTSNDAFLTVDGSTATGAAEGTAYATLTLTVGGTTYASGINTAAITVHAAPTGFIATFHVPEGAAAPAAITQTGASITLPAAVAAPASCDAHTYTFAGWVKSQVAYNDASFDPTTILAAGESVTLNANTDFYALYTYEKAGSGAGTEAYSLAAAVPTYGDSIIIACKDGDTYYALNNAVKGNADGDEIDVSNGAITTEDVSAYTYTVCEYTDKNAAKHLQLQSSGNTSTYLKLNSSKITHTEQGDTGYLTITASNASAGLYTIVSEINNRQLNVSEHRFSGVSDGTATPIYIFVKGTVAPEPAAYYTTNPVAKTLTGYVAPTCTAEGFSGNWICSECGETVETGIVLDALGHDYAGVEDEDGTTWTCSRCGDSYFEAREFAVAYVLPDGVTAGEITRDPNNKNRITLPSMVSITQNTYAHTYTFAGWAFGIYDDSDTFDEENWYEPGATVEIDDDCAIFPIFTYGGGTSGGGDYNKVTSTSDLTDGTYLIVYESGNVALNGDLETIDATDNTVTVSVSNGTISATTTVDAAAFTFTASNGAFLGANGKYIYHTGSKNTLDTSESAQPNAVSFDNDGNVVIEGTNNYKLFFNKDNTQVRFRYYTSTTNEKIQLYKKDVGVTEPQTYTFTLEVLNLPDSYAVTIDPSRMTVPFGATGSFTVTLTNNGIPAEAEGIVLISGDDELILVDDADLSYLACETAGQTTVTAMVTAPDGEDYEATCTVTVVDPNQSYTVNYIQKTVSGKTYVYNWGSRNTTATFLTEQAAAYYNTAAYDFDALMEMTGSNASDTSFYNSQLGNAIKAVITGKNPTKTTYDGTTSLYPFTDCEASDTEHISTYYTGKTLTNDWTPDTNWNREHVWPNSKCTNDAHRDDGADIMMLRPESASDNSSRGNAAFGESSGFFNPQTKYGKNVQGDIARNMLFTLMRWGNTSKFYGSTGVFESRAILLKWMEEDPVDTWELGRNDAVERMIGIRNIFVDYPELAFKLLGAEVPEDYTTPSKSGIVAGATYATTKDANYEPVTAVSGGTPNSAARTAPASSTRGTAMSGSIGGAVVVDGKGDVYTAADFKEYGPAYGVYLAPGQALVFKLSGEEPTEMAIGAKAINSTPAELHVASLNSDNALNYLRQQSIASAVEQYYTLDLANLNWNIGESDTIIVYNAGPGVLDVTNLRYKGEAIDVTVGQKEAQKAARMIRIVYGAPITEPDPIEPTDLDLNFASAELVLNSDIAINFNVDEAVMNSAEDVYAVFTKALYNEAGEITGTYEETVNEAIYNEETGKYSFRFTGINPAEMGSAVTATLYGYRNGELISGKTVNYSVLTYVNNMFAKVEDAQFRALLADLAAYGEAAQNYISYNTANLVTASVADGLMAYATAEAPELSSCTAITGEGKVKFTGAYLSLREKVTVCYMIDAQEYDGNVADLELRIFDGSRQIGTAAFAEVDGKYIASFSGLNALQMRTVVTAEVYDGDTCVSNTLDYSVEFYAASKAVGNDALAALVNAMMNFGISAETYFAK